MLTLEDFEKLPDNEKLDRYEEMSNYDRFLWRVSCPMYPVFLKESDLTKEQKQNLTRIRKNLLKEGKITQEEFDLSEKEDA